MSLLTIFILSSLMADLILTVFNFLFWFKFIPNFKQVSFISRKFFIYLAWCFNFFPTVAMYVVAEKCFSLEYYKEHVLDWLVYPIIVGVFSWGLFLFTSIDKWVDKGSFKDDQ